MNRNYRYIRGTRDGAEAVEFDVFDAGGCYGYTCVVNVQRLFYGIKCHPCSNGDDFVLTDEDMAGVLDVLKKGRDSIKYGNVGKPKTREGWNNSGLNLDEYLAIGCEVDETLVDDMMNVLPPHRHKHGYLQAGEPFADVFDGRDGQKRYRATYDTFHRANKDGREIWVYDGHCFSDETINRIPERDVAGGMLREVRRKLDAKAECNTGCITGCKAYPFVINHYTEEAL